MKIRRIINKIRGVMDIPTLVKKGLTLGDNVFINWGGCIDESFCWLITIGNNVTLAPNVHILAHDASTKKALGYTKIGKVIIGNNVFIGASSIVLPGVTVGDNVIIGAGSIVTRDIPSDCVVAGNPARIICSYSDYLKKEKERMKITFSCAPNPCEQRCIKEFLDNNRIGFIE